MFTGLPESYHPNWHGFPKGPAKTLQGGVMGFAVSLGVRVPHRCGKTRVM